MHAPTLSTHDLDHAVLALREGVAVAIPTETVYGLAADACNEAAVAGIFALKGRPSFNPLIVHVTGLEMAARYGIITPQARQLATHFWPGALTLVVPRRPDCPISTLATAGGDTIALRCPAHPIAQQLLKAFDGGLAAPSANRSGRISPTTAQHVRDEFPDDALIVLDGGATTIGIESTVVDCTDPSGIRLLRHGSITAQEMTERGLTVLDGLQNSDRLRSPGLLLSHYAPSLPVRLNAHTIAEDEALLTFGSPAIAGTPAASLNLSPSGNLLEAAQQLYAMLRQLDQPHYCAIAIAPIPQEGIGLAINDRLERAAAPR